MGLCPIPVKNRAPVSSLLWIHHRRMSHVCQSCVFWLCGVVGLLIHNFPGPPLDGRAPGMLVVSFGTSHLAGPCASRRPLKSCDFTVAVTAPHISFQLLWARWLAPLAGGPCRVGSTTRGAAPGGSHLSIGWHHRHLRRHHKGPWRWHVGELDFVQRRRLDRHPKVARIS